MTTVLNLADNACPSTELAHNSKILEDGTIVLEPYRANFWDPIEDRVCLDCGTKITGAHLERVA